MNVPCLAILVMSGLQIFNAHPALYWGEDSDFDRPILSIHAVWTEYKMAKFLTRIEVVDRLDPIGRGNGGTWEDDGYEWYAGI